MRNSAINEIHTFGSRSNAQRPCPHYINVTIKSLPSALYPSPFEATTMPATGTHKRGFISACSRNSIPTLRTVGHLGASSNDWTDGLTETGSPLSSPLRAANQPGNLGMQRSPWLRSMSMQHTSRRPSQILITPSFCRWCRAIKKWPHSTLRVCAKSCPRLVSRHQPTGMDRSTPAVAMADQWQRLQMELGEQFWGDLTPQMRQSW